MANQAKSEKGFLANAFQGSFWNSRITSANVGRKELWLGYVAGPFGAMLLQSIVNSYFNQYLTDVLGFTASRGCGSPASWFCSPCSPRYWMPSPMS